MSGGAGAATAASGAGAPEAEADGAGDALSLALGAAIALAHGLAVAVGVVLAVEATGDGVALPHDRHAQHDSTTAAAIPARWGPMAGGLSTKARAIRSSAATPRDRTGPS